MKKYGVRIANLGPKVILVEQTSYSEKAGRYVIDHDEDGKKNKRHAKRDSDKEIADAVRAALAGEL